MQNLIVFCHRCLGWIEPQSDMCSECGADVDLDQPDPDMMSLAKTLGDARIVTGPVCIERPQLPNYGHLVGTSEGILFLPRLHRRVNGAWEGVSSQSVPGWWPFRPDPSSPRLLSWLRRPLTITTGDLRTGVESEEMQTTALADRLIDSPGGFFVPHRMIRGFTTRRRTIKLDRHSARSITLIDESDAGSVVTAFASLAAPASTDGTV